MATTKTYTKTINVTGHTSCTITYTLTETETTATVAITKIAWKNTRSTGLTEAISWQVDILGGGVSSVPGFPSTTQSGTASKGSKTWSKALSGVSKQATKPHSATNATAHMYAYFSDSEETYFKDVTVSLSIPAKTSYKVTLNANGGTGGTASLTKWHGETLSLTAGFTAPTRTGYRFVGWGTSSSATTTIATYTANAATTLYAVWEKLITGITLDVTTLRVTDGTSTEEDDEGTWCYGTCTYSITGPAAANVTFTVSVTPNTPQIVQDTFTATKTEDNTLNGSFVFRASGCATDASYTFMVEAVAENTSATQTVTKSQGNVLSMAYYVLDVLGDNYVSSGQRPAHGISFGAPCKTEGFHVAMPADFSDGLNVTGAIECAADTAWITLNGTIKYRIHHGVCYVCGDSVNGGTSVGTGGTNVGTLPVEARPSITVAGAASTKSNAANGQFSIDSSGVITVWNLQTSSPYWCFAAAFPVG